MKTTPAVWILKWLAQRRNHALQMDIMIHELSKDYAEAWPWPACAGSLSGKDAATSVTAQRHLPMRPKFLTIDIQPG
jgi:hypothetical protein